MANLKDTKRRIVSVKNTQKITHAMKLVSAAKFSRANHAVISARPYAKAFRALVQHFAAQTDGAIAHPLLRADEEKKSLLVLIASDRGLCGSLNTNLFKIATRWLDEKKREGVSVDLWTWGRRAGLFGRKRGSVTGTREKVLDRPTFEIASALSDEVTKAFLEGGYQRIYLGYVEFKSALSQTPVVQQLLPFGMSDALTTEERLAARNMIVEPERDQLIDSLLKRAVSGAVFRALLEGQASEHGARMTAMDSATKNAKEVIRKLSLQYNRGRQAAITKELIEITSGADAL